MTSPTTKPDAVQPEAVEPVALFDDWFAPIETALRDRVREFIETMISSELDAALARPRYARRPAGARGGGGGGDGGGARWGGGRWRCGRGRRSPARPPDAHPDRHLRDDTGEPAARPHRGRGRRDGRVEEQGTQ